MKAIVLAAGKGERLRPYTDEVPKCMVKYQGKEIIDYILETLRQVGINNIIIVNGYKKEKLIKPGVQFYTNSNYDTTNMVYSFFCAQKEFDDDIIISYGDIIYDSAILEKLIKEDAPIAVVVDENWKDLWSLRMENPLNDAETMKLDTNKNILELGRKPKSYDDIEGQYIGLIKIRKDALTEIKNYYYSLDRGSSYDGKDLDNMYMTTFIQLVIDNLMPVKAVLINNNWMEFDSVTDLKITR